MGQYYKIVNVDKREMLVPWDFDNGAKLMEWSYNKNEMSLALMNLLAGNWKGDRVFVVGDYAECDDETEPFYNALLTVLNELGINPVGVENEEGTDEEDSRATSLYGYTSDNYTNIGKDVSVEDAGLKYIYNHGTKQFINMDHCPIVCVWANNTGDVSATRIFALSLLLAMGNGRGGGDFHTHAKNGLEHVGTWCDTSDKIEVSAIPLDYDYLEFCPDFAEGTINPYTKFEDMSERLKQQWEKDNTKNYLSE